MGLIAKIILKSRDNYDATEKYNELDWVRYNGCAWVAKKETIGNPPPTSPDLKDEYWSLLSRDGQYTGSMPTWNQIDEKPFNTVSSEDFTVDNGKLEVNFPDFPEQNIETVSDKFTLENKELDLKIDNRTIQQDAEGKLYANVTSAGFDIHTLDATSTLKSTDEFPLYSPTASKTLKATFGTIFNSISASFTKIYDSARGLIGSTFIIDTVEDINNNNTPNQIAGAKAVKNIYQYIAPLPTEAPAFSSSNDYEKGSVVSYNGSVYYAKESITKSSWNPSKWQLWTDNIPFRFGIDADGNYGYYKAGADSVTPFKTDSGGGGGEVTGKVVLKREVVATGVSGTQTYNIANMFPKVDLTNVTSDNFAMLQTNAPSGTNDSSLTALAAGQYKVRALLSSGAPSITYSNGTLTIKTPSLKAQANQMGTATMATVTANAQVSVYFYHAELVEE